jgi:trans-AT polyketide synthase/acyltransferase/oxidoreductase domain-containing protein
VTGPLKACVFPGQGSQFVGMGAGLFARYPEATGTADEILGYSVAELCLEDPRRLLHQTRYTQPALYVVNALTYRSRCDAGEPPPDFVAGHSLGEYNALLAAEVFDFATGLSLVKRRGELMAGASGGAMAAVLGCDWGRVEEVLRSHGLLTLDVANYNTPSQVVLAGPAEDIARVEAVFSDLGITCIPLKNVGAAFHSRYMEACVEPLGEALESVELRRPKIPVIANVSARPYDLDEVRDHLRRQIRAPVRWAESIRYLLDEGVEDYEEVGPGSVLTKLIKAIRRQASPLRDGPGSQAAAPAAPAVTAERLGADSFRRDYNVRRAYVAGSMYQGIASRDLVVRLGRAGYLGFFGAGGLATSAVEESIRAIRSSLSNGESFGVNLLANPDDPASEMVLVELCLRHGVRFIEAAGHVTASPALVRFRLTGLAREGGGPLASKHKVMVKVSRPEVAAAFLNPPPEPVVARLLSAGLVSAEAARWARRIPMADDICVEADSGGYSGMGAMAVLLPAIIRQRDEACRRGEHDLEVRVGGSGGIGTPEAAAAAFLLGADFILTGSINQCSVEAGTSDDVKDLLQAIDVQDTEHAPAGDLFELGAKIQVLKKGVLFPARANRLYELWRHHGSWEEIEAPVRAKIERDYFGRDFERAYEESKRYFLACSPEEIEKAERDERHKMAVVFRWYLVHTMHLALSGAKDQRANYQVRCGPALGAFNRWVRGTGLEPWRHRHVDGIADRIMEGAAAVLNSRLSKFAAP